MASQTEDPGRFEGLEGEFVAYLDGEVSAETSQRLEELIAQDEAARSRLRGLERAWEALDALPRSRVGDRFTSSTVEMIALAQDEEAGMAQRAAARANRGYWALIGLVCAAVATASFALATKVAERSNETLLRNLSVIESLDEYRQVESMEFLRRLSDRQLFNTSGSTRAGNNGL
jgi:anti-sigma-K factor RskA